MRNLYKVQFGEVEEISLDEYLSDVGADGPYILGIDYVFVIADSAESALLTAEEHEDGNIQADNHIYCGATIGALSDYDLPEAGE